MHTSARIVALNRYPIKGFSAEPLESITLVKCRPFPGDRLYAIENGPSGYDPGNPKFQPKLKCLELMRNPRLSALDTRFDHASRTLRIDLNGATVAEGDLSTAAGRGVIEAFLGGYMADELRGPVKVLEGTLGYQFMDSPSSGAVSLIGLPSLRDLAAKAGRRDLDPGRFRMNIVLDGLPPWGEFDLVGRTVRLGAARLAIVKRTDRCAAIDVAPGRGIRDLGLVRLLEERYGHHDCGIYAQVLDGGEVRVGDMLEQEQGALL